MGGLTTLFTNPLLLWFLPLALIPVLLHLLTLHRLGYADYDGKFFQHTAHDDPL